MSKYVFVADEMGNPGVSPNTSNTYVFGGYVVNESQLSQAVGTWRETKDEMCGNPDAELKWKHFFIEQGHPEIDNPLKVQNNEGRHFLAFLALDYLFTKSSVQPLMAISRKDRATEFFITKRKKGRDKIDDDLMWLGPVAMFATFLNLKKGAGRLVFDQLGSKTHENRRQSDWSKQLTSIRNHELPNKVQNNLEKLLSIEEEITFLDSETNESIQVADFLCGVIWKAGEGDERLLAKFENKYGDMASRQGLGIMHIA